MNITSDHHAKIIEDTFNNIRMLSGSKGEEYTGHQGIANTHANFDRLSDKLQIEPDKVLWVYLTKHLDSIETYINELSKPARKLSEPIEGRIDDAILYLILMKGLVMRRSAPKISSEEEQLARQNKLTPIAWPGGTTNVNANLGR